MTHPHRAFTALAVLALVAATGCRVETTKHGDNSDVKMATPFGNMQVKTDDKAVAEGVGLPLYPGAIPIKKDEHGKGDGAADINMSFGSFKMRIKALSFHSDDAPDKILAFYRPAMAKYGDVLECNNDRAVGSLTKTSQGLTCDNKKSNHISVQDDDTSGKHELKAGSEQHQHIVAAEKDGNGTKLGLVSLDLPGHMSFGDDSKDDDKQ